MKVIEQWDKAASAYQKKQESSFFVKQNQEIVKKRFTNLSNQSVLDVGCGYGWYCNYFSEMEADVIGCDGSYSMLEIARSKYPKLHFDQVDLLKKLPYQEEQFDLIFCNQVLMDIESLQPLIDEIMRICKKEGIFYISIVHPAFYDASWQCDEHNFKYAKIMDKYLSEYDFDQNLWGETRHYHRTISTYLNTIIAAGFQLVDLQEPSSYDGIEKTLEFPLFLFAEFKK